MEQSTSRIRWDENEIKIVAERYIELSKTLNEGAALAEAQKALPENRHRNGLTGLSQASRIVKYIETKLGVVIEKTTRTQKAPKVDPPLSIDSISDDELEAALRARKPILFAPPPPPNVTDLPESAIIEHLAQNRPELFVAGATTTTLIEMLLGRFFYAFNLERQRLEDSVAKQVTSQLNNDRAQFERRLFDIQQQIRGLSNGGLKQNNVVVAPAPEDKSSYMPIFIIAGGDRADFQRLQAQMINASIRLQKVDVSKPQHISIPTHDRVLIWAAKLPTDLQNNVRGKVNPQKLMIHNGTFDELGPIIVKEALKVREAMV